MMTTILTPAQKLVLVKLRLARAGIPCVVRVFALPPGGWPETRQAIAQAEDVLPQGVSLAAAMDAVKAAGLVKHTHPDRTAS